MLAKAMEELKKDARKELDETNPLDGVQPMPGSIRCAKLSFSAIMASPSLSLAPDYYIQNCQTDAVSSYLLADGISFDTFLARLAKCLEDKAVTIKGSHTFLNPNTVATLEGIRAALA